MEDVDYEIWCAYVNEEVASLNKENEEYWNSLEDDCLPAVQPANAVCPALTRQ